MYLKQSSTLKINDLQGREEKLLLCNAEKGPDDQSLGPFPDDVIISLNNKFLMMWKKEEEEIKEKRGLCSNEEQKELVATGSQENICLGEVSALCN